VKEWLNESERCLLTEYSVPGVSSVLMNEVTFQL